MATKRWILGAFQTLKTELGLVSEVEDSGDPRLIVAFDDNPANFGERRSVAQVVTLLIDNRLVSLIGAEAMWEDGDVATKFTLALYRNFPDEIRRPALDGLMEKLQAHPAVYAHSLAKATSTLCGLEEKEDYRKAQALWLECTPARDYFNRLTANSQLTQKHIDEAPSEIRRLFGVINEYHTVLDRRASTMLRNLLGRMSSLSVQEAALVACTPLLDEICKKMRASSVSYVRVRPFSSTASDQARYEEIMRGGDRS